MRIIAFLKIVIERPLCKCIGPYLPERSQVHRIGIAKKKKPVFFPQLGQQLYALGGKVEQQRIPAVHNGLIRHGKPRQLPDRIDELTVVDPRDLIVLEKRGSKSMAEIFPEILYSERNEGILSPLVVQVENDAAQVEYDILDALHG